jgi:RNA polymerase sigma-70 factor (ECF subfamily)
MENRPRDDLYDVDVELGRAWRDHRRHLLDIALRMVGNLSEAEDAVGEAFARLVRADLDEIDDIGGWLVVVVSRLCLDRLRAQRRRPTLPDTALTERAGSIAVDPADRVTLDDNVRIALHLVLERLTPAERTAFVLHDVFQYSFEAVSDIVGRTPAACRQLASRARRAIASDAAPSRSVIESDEQRRVTEQFIAACSTGDLDGLLAVLDPEVAGEGDLGGGRTRLATGRDRIAPQLMVFLGPDSDTTLVSLHRGDKAEVVALRGGKVVTLVTLALRDGRVHDIHALVDPVKLAPTADALSKRRG